MAYQFHTDTNPEILDEFVMNSDQNSLFQCSNWSSIKNNWDHLYTSVTENDKVVATALVLIRKLPFGLTLLYVPRGPVMDYQNHMLVSFYIAELKKIGKQRHSIEVIFDPLILSRKYPYKERRKEHPYENENVIQYMKSLGLKWKGYTIHIMDSTQPRFNAEMDVIPNYKDHLEHKTLKCIRTAEHKGIEVYEGQEYLSDFSAAMYYTEVRKQVSLRDENYFRNMMKVYGNHSICMVAKLNFPRQLEKLQKAIQESEQKLNQPDIKKKEINLLNQQLTNDKKELEKLKADYKREGKDEVITCGILAAYNDSLMELFYMGNNPHYLRMYSSYLLYSKCLDRCVDLGITHCSFGGIEGTLDDGLTLFKSNWIMNVEEYIGEFNLVLNPFMYMMFDKVYPFVRENAIKIKVKFNGTANM